MVPERRRSRQARRIMNVVLALGVSAVLLAVLGAGYGTLPGLGAALDPGHGAWASASDGRLPGSQTLKLPGLAHPVGVSFTRQGIASISAATDSDLYLALGYVHARFRLAQMDLERRLGEGRLAQLAGPAAVASDKFELRLGLLRTARQEWADMPRSSPAARALLAYSRGVNDYLASVRASHQWPALFSLAGVYPANWTPVDSLVIQGDLTQELDFTTVPLDYALLERSLGARATMAWFPVLAPGQQSPDDPGPYRNRGIAPIVTSGSLTAAGPASAAAAGTLDGTTADRAVPGQDPVSPGGAVARAAAAILAEVSALPAGQVHQYPDSNAWAADGPKVAGGGAMLAGDPHLPQTLPSVWYQVALAAPGLAVSGVSTPGLPGVLLGHNADIAWSLTDTQNQSTMFYDEKTAASRPGEYFWWGQWRRMRQVRYSIPVRGGATRQVTVDITVHGPVMTTAGQTVSVDWMGAIPSPDLAVLLEINRATDFAQFSAALASWRSPTQNFVYADHHGNIGAISAGYYPLVRHGDPWLPMPGTGADDVAGVIPQASVPRAYDPRGHVIATANQRPVGDSYPYYIGTTANDFDAGYRAATEYAYLRGHESMTPASFAALQASLSDQLARQVVPRLLAALRHVKLPAAEQQASQVLAHWNYWMGPQSAGASVWWTFWTDYLSAVFQPWWTARRVPVHLDRAGLAVGPGQFSLDEMLESWTLHDRGNAAFSPPGGPARDAAAAMRAAFAAAVTHLRSKLGGAPATWSWGRLHSTQFPSLAPATALGYGPRPSGGDPWTVDAADGGMVSSAGPSWRMIAHWTGSGAAVGEGIYPGGQSENPASPWYDNLMADWRAGRYLPMPVAGARAGGAGTIRWELRP
jgi:penicillin G amidase